jgi:cell division septal protein FtsQ
MGKKKKGKKGWFGNTIDAVIDGISWLIWRLIPLAVIAAVLVYVGFVVKKGLCEDKWLRVQSIRIIPPDALSPQSIRTLEDKILGKNILTLDLKKIAGTIELGPGAQSVRVVREMPSTLRIEIKKRKPIANVQFRSGGAYGIAAEDGYIIDVRSELDPAWILMEDYTEPYKEPKVGLKLQNKGFAEALRFLQIFKRHDLAKSETVTRVILDTNGYVTVRLGAGPDFKLGRKASEQVPALASAVYLLNTEPRENVEYMDLQYGRVAVKRKA